MGDDDDDSAALAAESRRCVALATDGSAFTPLLVAQARSALAADGSDSRTCCPSWCRQPAPDSPPRRRAATADEAAQSSDE